MAKTDCLACYASTVVGFIPIAWVTIKRPSDRAWWWLALAFGVSGIADVAGFFGSHALVSPVYTVSQSALVGFVFLARRDALAFVVCLALVGVASLFTGQPDVLLHTVAWGGVVGIVIDRPALGLLRAALLVTFGLGLLEWWTYALVPGLATWTHYQTMRLMGTLAFCVAVRQGPRLRLARS